MSGQTTVSPAVINCGATRCQVAEVLGWPWIRRRPDPGAESHAQLRPRSTISSANPSNMVTSTFKSNGFLMSNVHSIVSKFCDVWEYSRAAKFGAPSYTPLGYWAAGKASTPNVHAYHSAELDPDQRI